MRSCSFNYETLEVICTATALAGAAPNMLLRLHYNIAEMYEHYYER